MADAKNTVVKLQIKAAQANPAPPVGTALGPHGINIAGFCKEFNDRTSNQPGLEPGMLVPVEITIKKDRSFSFILKSPPAAVLILKALGLGKGSSTPSTEVVGHLTLDQMKTIVEVKKNDLNAYTEEQAVKIIAGTARSMGITTDLDHSTGGK